MIYAKYLSSIRFSDIDNFVGQFLLGFSITYNNLDCVVAIILNH